MLRGDRSQVAPGIGNDAEVRRTLPLVGRAMRTTTETWTHVAITKLAQVHTATHPAARLAPRSEKPDA